MSDREQQEIKELEELANREYKYGFVTDVDSDSVEKGLNEDIIRTISSKKNEPEWLLDFRLKALRRFFEMLENESEPTWAKVDYPKIDYQDIIYYSAPVQKKKLESLDEVDPELLEAYEKLGISLNEQKFLAEFNERNGDEKDEEKDEEEEKDESDENPVVLRDYYFNEVLAITLDFLKLGHQIAAAE